MRVYANEYTLINTFSRARPDSVINLDKINAFPVIIVQRMKLPSMSQKRACIRDYNFALAFAKLIVIP